MPERDEKRENEFSFQVERPPGVDDTVGQRIARDEITTRGPGEPTSVPPRRPHPLIEFAIEEAKGTFTQPALRRWVGGLFGDEETEEKSVDYPEGSMAHRLSQMKVDQDRLAAQMAMDTDRIGGSDEQVANLLGIEVDELRQSELRSMSNDDFHDLISEMYEDMGRFSPGVRKAVHREKLVRDAKKEYLSLADKGALGQTAFSAFHYAERVAGFAGGMNFLSEKGLRPEKYPGETPIREEARYRIIHEDDHTLRSFLNQWGPELPRVLLEFHVAKKMLGATLGPGGSYVGMENLWNKLPYIAKAGASLGGTFATRTGMQLDKDWTWQERLSESAKSGGVGLSVGVAGGVGSFAGIPELATRIGTAGGLVGLGYASHRDAETAIGHSFLMAGLIATGSLKKHFATKKMTDMQSKQFQRDFDRSLRSRGIDPKTITPSAKSKLTHAFAKFRTKIGQLTARENKGAISKSAAQKASAKAKQEFIETGRPQWNKILQDIQKSWMGKSGYSPETFAKAQKLLPPGKTPSAPAQQPAKTEVPVPKATVPTDPIQPAQPEEPVSFVPIPDSPPNTDGEGLSWERGYDIAIQKTHDQAHKEGDPVQPMPSDIEAIEQELGREMTDLERGHFLDGFKLAMGDDYSPIPQFPHPDTPRESELLDLLSESEVQERAEAAGVDTKGKSRDDVLEDTLREEMVKQTGSDEYYTVAKDFEQGEDVGYEENTPYWIPFDKIELDPETYQFKKGVDEKGLTGRYREVDTWRPEDGSGVQVHRKKDGTFKISHGHHRYHIFSQAREAGKLPKDHPDAMAVYVKDERRGWTDDMAILNAAQSNVVSRHTNSWATARVMRDLDYGVEFMTKAGLDPRQKEVRDAKGLTELSTEAFNWGEVSDVKESHAALVGELMGDRSTDVQIQALQKLEKANFDTVTEAKSLVRRIAEAKTEKQTTLLGEVEKSNWEIEVAVEKAIIDDIKADKNAMVPNVDKVKKQARAAGRELTDREAKKEAKKQGEVKHASVIVKDLLEYGTLHDGPIKDAFKKAVDSYIENPTSKGLSNAKNRFIKELLSMDIKGAYPELEMVTPGLTENFERYQNVKQGTEDESGQLSLTDAASRAVEDIETTPGVEVQPEGTQVPEPEPPTVAPSVRSYAKEVGVPERVLTEYAGTGKKGSWTKADIDRFLEDGEVKYATDMGHELMPFGAEPPRSVRWLPETSRDIGDSIEKLKSRIMSDVGTDAKALPEESRLAKEALQRPTWINADLGDRYAHYNSNTGEVAINEQLIDSMPLSELQSDVLKTFGIRNVAIPEVGGKTLGEILMPDHDSVKNALFEHERGHARTLAIEDGKIADAARQTGDLEELADMEAMNALEWTADKVLDSVTPDIPKDSIGTKGVDPVDVKNKARRRMFAISNKYDLSREQRILMTRQLFARPDLDSTKELTTSEMVQLADYLSAYQDYLSKPQREPSEEEMKYLSANDPDMQETLNNESWMSEAERFADEETYQSSLFQIEEQVHQMEAMGGQPVFSSDIAKMFDMPEPEFDEPIGHLFADADNLFIPKAGDIEDWTEDDIAEMSKNPTILSYFRPLRKYLPQGAFQEALPARHGGMDYSNKMEGIRHKITHGLSKDELVEVSMMMEGLKEKEGKLGNVADRLREDVLDPIHNKLVNARVLSEDQYVDDYFPHVQEMYESITGATLDAPNRWFTHERTGDLGDYNRNAAEVIDMYIRASSKALYLDPWLDKWSPVFKELPVRHRAIIETFVDALYGHPTVTEELMDNTMNVVWKGIGNVLGKDFHTVEGKRYASNVSRFFSSAFIQNVMGFNPWSVVKNMFQKIHNIAEVSAMPTKDNPLKPIRGIDLWMKARKALMTPEGKEFNKKFNILRRNRVFTAGLDTIAEQDSKLTGILDNTSKITMAGFKFADKTNIDEAFMMKWLANIEDGVGVRESLLSANDATIRTQFAYGIGKPALFRGPIGRSIGIVSQWPIEYFEMHGDWLKEKGWGKIPIAIGLAALSSYVLRRLGMKMRIGVGHTAGSHILARVAAQERLPILSKADDIQGAVKRILDRDDDTTVEALIELAEDTLPAGQQAARIRRFKNAYENDWRLLDRRGNVVRKYAFEGILYDEFGVPGEAVRHLFGETAESFEYWSDIYPPAHKRLWRFLNPEEQQRRRQPPGLRTRPSAGPGDTSPRTSP